MNHTKGPWKLCYGDHKGLHIKNESKDKLICLVNCSEEDLSADAALIAAAPELYEIVSLMANGAITYEDPRINTALNKARGKK